MATKYYRSNNSDWNTDANWSTTSGGGADTTFPVAGDDVIFDANSGTCTLDADAACATVTYSSYTGRLDIGSSTLTTSGDVAITGGLIGVGTGVWSVGGNWAVVSLAGACTGTTGKVELTGSAKTVRHSTINTLPMLRITGTYTSSSTVRVVALKVAGTYTLAADQGNSISNVYVESGGVFAGSFLQVLAKLAQHDGTVSCSLQFTNVGAGDFAPAGCTLGGPVVITSTTNSSVQWPSSITFGSSLSIYARDASETITMRLDTNNCSPTFQGNVDLSDPTGAGSTAWTNGTGTMRFTLGANQAVNLRGKTVEDIVIEKSAGTVTFTNGWTADSFTMGGASDASTLAFNATGDTLTTTGNWTIGANGQVDPTNLDGWTWSVGGNLSLAGDASADLNLVATGTWTLTVTGTATATYVNVAYSDADAGTAIDADDGTNTDSLNNLGWNFGAAEDVSSSSSSTALYSWSSSSSLGDVSSSSSSSVGITSSSSSSLAFSLSSSSSSVEFSSSSSSSSSLAESSSSSSSSVGVSASSVSSSSSLAFSESSLSSPSSASSLSSPSSSSSLGESSSSSSIGVTSSSSSSLAFSSSSSSTAVADLSSTSTSLEFSSSSSSSSSLSASSSSSSSSVARGGIWIVEATQTWVFGAQRALVRTGLEEGMVFTPGASAGWG